MRFLVDEYASIYLGNFMKRISIIIFIVIVFSLCTSEIFAQCSCEPQLTLKEHFQRADAVFVGRVIEAKKTQQDEAGNFEIIVKFEVTQTWKQALSNFVVVKEINGSLDGFELNKEWLLYATKENDGTYRIFRGCCSRTKYLSVAKKQADLKAFKTLGEKPKKIIEKDK